MEEDVQTSLAKAKIDSLDEIGLYFIINECGGFVWRMQHDMAHGRIPDDHHAAIDVDIVRIRGLQQYAVSKLDKLGFVPTVEDGRPTEDYWKWFRWWDSYIKGLSNEEWNVLDNKIKKEEDISAYRPKGDWKIEV